MSGIDIARSGLDSDFSIEVLGRIVPQKWVHDAVAELNARSKRGRTLSAVFTVWFVVLMGLRRRVSYENLLESIRGTWWGCRLWKPSQRPASSAISKARDRVGVAPVRELFKRTAGLWVNGHAGMIVNGRRVCALDGLTCKVPDSAANRAHFGLPGNSRGRSSFPQMRAVHLLDLDTRIVCDVEAGPYAEGEMTLARRLLERIPVGSVLLLDRNFVSFEFLFRLHRHCRCDFVVRGKKRMGGPVIERLSPGDEIVELQVSRALRRLHPGLPKVWRLRRVTFRTDGHKDPIVVFTTILDTAIRKQELVRLYLRRWEIETSNGELKTHLASCATVNHPVPLRSKTPSRVLQELYGLLIAYNAIRKLTADSAAAHGADPLRVSFVWSLERVREAARDMARLPSASLPTRYDELLDSIHRAQIPRRPGRRVRREVKVKMSKYPVKEYGVEAA